MHTVLLSDLVYPLTKIRRNLNEMDFMKYQRCQKISMFFQLFQQASYFPQYNPVKQIIFWISTSFRILAIIIQCLCDNASSTVLEELQQLHVNHTEQLSQIPPLFYVSMSFSKNQFIQFQIHLVWITFHMLDVIINLRPQRFELDKEIQKEQNIEVH
ncbi:unnamed protein product [Paramecium octaurelia]|uniref:Uncharacterized protein n=1 Tax=Paramecium octaurelia TaxID=43137 RepID=A0A8S1YKJ6_PAROT|nr:unnamed protein product [Paramecium octaurelia]